jgi:hypothetical protein
MYGYENWFKSILLAQSASSENFPSNSQVDSILRTKQSSFGGW